MLTFILSLTFCSIGSTLNQVLSEQVFSQVGDRETSPDSFTTPTLPPPETSLKGLPHPLVVYSPSSSEGPPISGI